MYVNRVMKPWIIQTDFHILISLVSSIRSKINFYSLTKKEEWGSLARRRKGMPPPPQTINIRISMTSYEVLAKAKRHKDEPIYSVVNRILQSYKEIKNGYDSDVPELKEWLELANNDKTEYKKKIEKLRLNIKNLEDANRWLTDRLYYLEEKQLQDLKIPKVIN